ncbi:hypothetical protein [Actinosynnema sp. NPDC020468]|uniref:hypothetical protein n=1 Tax=Actinosynnema sp. NPDC020468 TaxID=3154488 RepID=UPI003411E5EE
MTDVTTTSALRATGVPDYRIALRCRPGGPWQRVLPGVVLLSATPPTRAQRVRAAVAYAGEGAVVTGVDALRAHGVPLPCPPRVHVLQPATRRRSGHEHLRLERTTRPPPPVTKAGIPYAPPARAAADAARSEHHPIRLHHLLTEVIARGLCTPDALLTELAHGSRRGTAAPKAILTTLRAHLPDHSRTDTG